MSGAESFQERLQGLYRPVVPMMLGVYYLFYTLLTQPLLLPTKGLTALRLTSFANLWKAYGKQMSEDMPPRLTSLLGTVQGVVLDVGPGTGDQLHHFDPKQITKVIGAEPATELHHSLRKAAIRVGFSVRGKGSGKDGCGEYVPLAAGAESDSLIPALAKMGLLNGTSATSAAGESVFDDIVCVRSLCGVPHHAETIRNLYQLLKPGGRIVLYEHVRQDYDPLAKIMQTIFVWMGWKFFMGGCELDRPTDKALVDAAGKEGWSEIKLDVLADYAALPYIIGYLVKRSN